jgi:hypothetical protein
MLGIAEFPIGRSLPGGPIWWVLELPMSLHDVPNSPKTAMISEEDAITRCFFIILVGYWGASEFPIAIQVIC